jgi:hypothetical protein
VSVVWKPRSGKVPDSKRCDRLTTSKLASGAQAAELPARRPTSRLCVESPAPDDERP